MARPFRDRLLPLVEMRYNWRSPYVFKGENVVDDPHGLPHACLHIFDNIRDALIGAKPSKYVSYFMDRSQILIQISDLYLIWR